MVRRERLSLADPGREQALTDGEASECPPRVAVLARERPDHSLRHHHLEHLEWSWPPGSFQLPTLAGGHGPGPFPDVTAWSHREYGHRVGIFVGPVVLAVGQTLLAAWVGEAEPLPPDQA